MLYKDLLHPLSLSWLAYDVLCVVVRSFSPETLVRKRPKRGSKAKERRHRRDHSLLESRDYRSRHNSSGDHESTDPSPRFTSHNTSLQANASAGSERPPTVPSRAAAGSGSSRPPSRAGSRLNSRSSSRSGSRHHTEVPLNEGPPQSFFGRLRNWRTINVREPVLLLTHVLRAMPVAVLHCFTQLRTDVATLGLLRFSDLSDTAAALLVFNEDAVFAPDFVWNFTITRCLLGAMQQYVLGRVCLETNFVVNRLRSRRAYRHIIGWAMRLLTRLLTDPISCSILSPMLLCTVKDFSPVTGPLRYTPSGLCAAALTGFVGVVLEQLVLPTAAICCQRVVVHIYDGLDYVLTRRYATKNIMRDEAVDSRVNASGIDSATASEDDRESGQRTARKDAESAKRHSHNREDAQQVGKGAQMAVFRAIICRVVGALLAQCAVQHPLTVLSRLLYARAVLHGTGLLKSYADFPAKHLVWADFAAFLKQNAHGSSSGVPALEALRGIGCFVGCEVSLIRSSILRCSAQERAIEELLLQAERRRQGGADSAGMSFTSSVSHASALESMELMTRCIASTSPLFNMVHLTSFTKLLSFYMDMWVRLRGE
ncbi:hypothetical protein, conserved [Trypanosoma brucei brucei TREU927]|uniref:Uncharacterized protein n=1 Tax=Trypanosoma brucei brucei (strain 927/4 GUTat10.1) TaxID=185431 RepID=Q57W28_TRYB2|nr:hypothetical protein, conserved [Trypanosoma brucei brucei TREU927]AAX70191.1 hypothetical protein, conserved [Trypanosoma brucei]AAZ11198.1 hypothetical protein, conserved [Trypanosoma brucei brucei TREU927]